MRLRASKTAKSASPTINSKRRRRFDRCVDAKSQIYLPCRRESGERGAGRAARLGTFTMPGRQSKITRRNKELRKQREAEQQVGGGFVCLPYATAFRPVGPCGTRWGKQWAHVRGSTSTPSRCPPAAPAHHRAAHAPSAPILDSPHQGCGLAREPPPPLERSDPSGAARAGPAPLHPHGRGGPGSASSASAASAASPRTRARARGSRHGAAGLP